MNDRDWSNTTNTLPFIKLISVVASPQPSKNVLLSPLYFGVYGRGQTKKKFEKMASGTGRLTFLDPAALRSIYPGAFNTEFMFRSPSNLFSTVQFIPERVVEFSISPVS
jgi:hypothetical protein